MKGKRFVVCCSIVVGVAAALYIGCKGSVVNPTGQGDGGGTGDGRRGDGPGTFDDSGAVLCPDCNDSDVGKDAPFPIDASKDGQLKEANGVKLDDNGDLVLGANLASLGYMWIANTDDLGRGTLSKVDTRNLKEVARYLTVTCRSRAADGAGCLDVNGRPIKAANKHTPSRTAVDFNMDVWVANRCLNGCQPSVTKVANMQADCIDRNNNGKIDTSIDHDGDGQINTDCDGDGKPDTLATKCTNGKPPEFLGDDDECVLFTANVGDPGDICRSICLDGGKANIGASNAWVGTYKRPENDRGNNLYYKLNGYTGLTEQTVTLPKEHHAYGCMADAHHNIWSTDIGHYEHSEHGNLTYFQSVHPYQVGKVLRGPTKDAPWKGANKLYRHYGIAIDAQQDIWLGGIDSEWVLRYQPDRKGFDSLGNGQWTRIDLPSGFRSRGLAADNRGKVWVAIQKGSLLRLEQSIQAGIHDFRSIQEGKDYWNLTAREVIGAGVDIDLNVWGVGKSNSTASRLDVDAKGDVVLPSTGTAKNVKVGYQPYTYSDFTGFGLRNFVLPKGVWSYVHQLCPDGQKATWRGVSWNATKPAGTAVTLRVRTGDSDASFGSWTTTFEASPADFGPNSANPVSPNPARLLQVEFTLSNPDQKSTPILHDYSIIYTCIGDIG